MDGSIVSLATWQVWFIGLVASLLVSLINWLAKPKVIRLGVKVWALPGVRMGRFGKTVLLLLIAGGLGYWWFPILLPALPVLSGLTFGPGVEAVFAYAKALVTVLMPYVGTAVFLYNLLLSYFTDPAKRDRLWKSVKDWVMQQAGIPPKTWDDSAN